MYMRKNFYLMAFMLLPWSISKVMAQEIMETGGKAMPLEWIDKDTGHKVIRLSRREGTNASFYFNNPCFIPSKGTGDLMVFYGGTAKGNQLFVMNLKTLESQ